MIKFIYFHHFSLKHDFFLYILYHFKLSYLSLPKPSTTTYGLNSFSYSSVKYWNSLPDHFRKAVDYSEFKRKLLVHSFS